MHLIFSFWTASSQADPWSQSLHSPLLNFCFQPSTSASWIQGQITKLVWKTSFDEKSFPVSVPVRFTEVPFLELQVLELCLYVPSCSFRFVSWTKAVVCGLSLEQKCFSQPCVSCSLRQECRSIQARCCSPALWSVCSLVLACQVKADKELMLWTLVSRHKWRIETSF